MIIRWIIVVVTATCLVFNCTSGQLTDNTPPVMRLDRNWILLDSEPIGSIVTRVHAKDNEQDKLIYGLESLDHNYNNGDLTLTTTGSLSPLPFSIDNKTGVIYINETLKGRGGENLYLYVTVSDGQLTAKNEVYVIIKNSSLPSSADNNNNNYGSPFSSNNKHHINSGLNQHQPIRGPPFLVHFSNSPLSPFKRPSINLTNTQQKTTILRPAQIDINNNELDELSTTNVKTTTLSNMNVYNNSLESTNVEANKENYSYQSITMTTFITIIAICAVIFGLGMGIWSIKGKICSSHKKSINTKEQIAVGVSDISSTNEPSLILKNWHNSKFSSNKYQEWNKNSNCNINNSNNNNKTSATECIKKQDDKWEFPRHRLKVFCILGEGCFGQVWKCEALDIDRTNSGKTSVVAVKTLKENATERERLDLAQELSVMKTLEPHPNVVKLLGCCTEREPIFVIMEYISGGKLQSFLRNMREERNCGRPGLTSSDLTGFVYQVAKGMEFLASKGIIHRDLAARNILIDNNRACKIADFGFARDIAVNKIYERKSEGRLPIRWMAPESLYDNMFSVKSDIWSFGVLIWEIVTLGSTPYPGMGAAEVMRKIKEGYRLERPEHCKRELYNIMYYCWDKDPSCRPSFGELVVMAEGLLLDEIDYIELDRFPNHSYYNVLNLSGEKL
ncbi:tyrosine kinase receptor Cad96Ca [Microplitis mediator]|uniref:tyrosine kinase receptor Cad96Ca n=1 Tax=Microplitis mediator TaxID=375433 RepID=UPI0025547A93|nr:tyrosine kinase receptor Cad96Ca [Microplitis mediator]